MSELPHLCLFAALVMAPFLLEFFVYHRLCFVALLQGLRRKECGVKEQRGSWEKQPCMQLRSLTLLSAGPVSLPLPRELMSPAFLGELLQAQRCR